MSLQVIGQFTRSKLVYKVKCITFIDEADVESIVTCQYEFILR